MVDTARPFLVVYIVWHPNFDLGPKVAKALFEHFRRENYERITGGSGISVVYRFAIADGTNRPLPIDFSSAETSAVIVLADQNFSGDPIWTSYLEEIVAQTAATGLATRLFR